MEKARQVLKTRKSLKYIIAAVLVIGLVGIVGVNAFAVDPSPLLFRDSAGITAQSVTAKVTDEVLKPDDPKAKQENLFKFDLTSLNNNEQLYKKDIIWSLSGSQAVMTFKDGATTLENGKSGVTLDSSYNTIDLYVKSAGKVTLTGQPQKMDTATNSLITTGISSASLDVISPLNISKINNAGTGNVITNDLPTSLIDPSDSAWKYIQFTTNVALSNLEVVIDGTTYDSASIANPTVLPAKLENRIYYTDNGRITIPTSLLKAGQSKIAIKTADAGNDKNLIKEYDVYVKPAFTSYENATSTSNMKSEKSQLYRVGTGTSSNDEYYYIYSEDAIKNGYKMIDLSAISNIPDNPKGYNVSIDNVTKIDGKDYTEKSRLIEVIGDTITANEVGIATVSITGPAPSGQTAPVITMKVVIPYTLYKNVTYTDTTGSTFTINTTGGKKELRNESNVIDKSWPKPKAIKAGTDKITAKMLLNNPKTSDYTYTGNELGLFNSLYQPADYNNELQSDFTFVIIDALSISPESAVVNLGETTDIVFTTTSTSPITYDIINVASGDLTYEVGNIEVLGSEEVPSSSNNIHKYVYHIKGTGVGYKQFVVRQTIDGNTKEKPCTIQVVNPINNIKLPDSLEVYIEDENATTIEAVFEPASERVKKIEWVADDSTLLDVKDTTPDFAANTTISGASAEIKGKKQGNTDVHIKVYTDEGIKDAHVNVTVRSHIDSIVLNQSKVEGKTGESFQLLATVKYKDGTTTINDGVTYTQTSFGDDPVVSVDPATGLVRFLKPGNATVTATVADSTGSLSASCDFSIEVPITDITLDHTDAQITIGETLSIKAIITPANATNQIVSWETSNASVATVTYTKDSYDSINVTVTGVAHGTATIICKAADGQIRMCTVYVKQPVTGITLDTQDTITIRKGQSIYLNATILPYNADDKTVVWSSSRPEYCTVDQYGMITGIEPTGENYEAVITVTSNDNPEIFATCKVKVIQPITGITLNSTYQEMWVGSKYAIIPDIQPADADNKKVTYISSDPEVASVDENGIVTALKGGTTVIEITTEQYGLKATCTILVKEYVTSITLDASEKYLGLGKTDKLTATVEAATATNRNVVWSSSDPDICSVDQQGNITGNNLGNAVITATAADGSGVVATCIVHVTESINGLRVEPDTVRIAIGSSYIVSAITDDGNVTNDVVWTSSNESIATVDEMGEIFGLSTGKCKVTATAKTDSMVSASCWVYVTPVVNISSLKINSSEIYMLTGKQRQLAVRVRPAVNTDSYDWYSTDTGIVTVNGSGLITTVGPGVADVVVESTNNGVSSACTVHSLAISRSNMRLEQYDSNVLDVIGIESGDKVTWRSSNPRIATVDASGNVIGRMRGTCNITAVTHDKTLYCTVTVFTAKKYN